MTFQIVSDSSSNLLRLEDAPYTTVPLKIVTSEQEFVDDEALDVPAMVEALANYNGRSGTSCPNVAEWLEAFGDAEGVFTVAITSNLSGSHNAAVQAAQSYMEAHPERRVCCLDSLSTGPEMVLIIEKLRQLTAKGMDFDAIEAAIRDYMTHTHLLFLLESADNLAKNGRVSPLIAKAVGFLGIRILGKASDVGTLQQLHKCRNERKAVDAILQEMEAMGYRGGKVHIAHVVNPGLGQRVRDAVAQRWPQADITVIPATGLCSFYAERGGLLLGFEDL